MVDVAGAYQYDHSSFFQSRDVRSCTNHTCGMNGNE
jgi:hypothetical protein